MLLRCEQGFDPRHFDQIPLEPIPAGVLDAARKEVDSLRVEPTLRPYLVNIVRRTRDWPAISLGASPRAAVALFSVARAFAAMEGRDFLVPDDIKSAAPPVLRHRLLLKPEADLEGVTSDQVIADVLRAVEDPEMRCRSSAGKELRHLMNRSLSEGTALAAPKGRGNLRGLTPEVGRTLEIQISKN